MSSGNKPLVKLIRQGKGGCRQNAECRAPGLPKAPALVARKTVEKQAEDAILNQMGQLAEKGVKKTERVQHKAEVKDLECPGQQAS
jgi:hypothetical protein